MALPELHARWPSPFHKHPVAVAPVGHRQAGTHPHKPTSTGTQTFVQCHTHTYPIVVAHSQVVALVDEEVVGAANVLIVVDNLRAWEAAGASHPCMLARACMHAPREAYGAWERLHVRAPPTLHARLP